MRLAGILQVLFQFLHKASAKSSSDVVEIYWGKMARELVEAMGAYSWATWFPLQRVQAPQAPKALSEAPRANQCCTLTV